ncbi:MAG: hypothetical protein BWZ10_02139 [candidate division BRC1 bacterium ADurb.BinA364]|nr:MAG: hypothetical protein BWZ10_02139 [candidate division BRC1 bacterium ADurb.BinA364]
MARNTIAANTSAKVNPRRRERPAMHARRGCVFPASGIEPMGRPTEPVRVPVIPMDPLPRARRARYSSGAILYPRLTLSGRNSTPYSSRSNR